MKIRTVTLGVREDTLSNAIPAAHEVRARLQAAGYQVDTLRLALSLQPAHQTMDLVSIAIAAEKKAMAAGFDLVSLGRVRLECMPQVPDALAATKMVVFTGRIAGRDGAVSQEGIRASAETIIANSQVSSDGFTNLRFAAMAGVGPGYPFFPSAYHDGGNPWIAIGPETASLGHQALQQQAVQENALLEMPGRLKNLTKLIEHHDQHIRSALKGLEAEHQVFVTGCDWSLTCGTTEETSVGALIEQLSGVPFGAMGTLVAISELNKAIRAARVHLIGFSGVILPVIGDIVLAQRNLEEPPSFRLRDLLAFSSVYGMGLDAIPLPGDCSVDQIVRILSEVASLAGILRKPLVARLLPMPGLRARDIVNVTIADEMWNAFIFPTRVLELL